MYSPFISPRPGGGGSATNAQSGTVSVGNGVGSVSVTFGTPFASTPNVVCNLQVPSGGSLIICDPDNSTVTTTGFTAVFNANTPNSNYKLSWIATV